MLEALDKKEISLENLISKSFENKTRNNYILSESFSAVSIWSYLWAKDFGMFDDGIDSPLAVASFKLLASLSTTCFSYSLLNFKDYINQNRNYKKDMNNLIKTNLPSNISSSSLGYFSQLGLNSIGFPNSVALGQHLSAIGISLFKWYWTKKNTDLMG